MKAEIEISDELINSLINSANVGYWCEYVDFSDSFDINSGKSLLFYLYEDDDIDGQSVFELNKEKVQQNLGKFATWYRFSDVLKDGCGDMIDGDVFVQTMLFGEIKYS